MKVKIVTRMLEDELYEATNEHGNSIKVDMRPREESVSQRPTEMLLSSLAACGAVDIVSMLKKRKKTIQSFTIETEGNRRDEAPRYFTDIHCKYIIQSPDATEEEVTKVSKLALEKYCSVASSLKSELTFSVEVIR